MRTDQKLFCLKCILTIFLVILWILGSAIFGLLLWLRLDFWTNEYIELDKSLDRYMILIYVALVDGALILIFSIFGLVGGLRSIKWCLVLYLTALCLAFGLTAAGIVYGFVYREELRDTVGKGSLMNDIMIKRFNGEANNKITRAVNIMQAELSCCGGDGPMDFLQSNWYQSEPKSRGEMSPASCCKDYHRYENSNAMCPIYEQTGNPTLQDRVYNKKINKEGCKTALFHFLEQYIVVVVGIAITVGIIQLVCVIIVSILIHFLNNLYIPQPDDIVYDMARNQEKSPYPSRGDYYR